MMVTLVCVTRAGVFEPFLAGQLQSFLQIFRHEFVLKDTVKDAEKKTYCPRTQKTIQCLHVCNFLLAIGNLHGFIVKHAGQLLQTSVKGRRVLLETGLGAALQVLGHHVLLDAEVRHLAHSVHVALEERLLLLHARHVPVLSG